jgi:Flp pilus assembly protein TadD
MGGGGGGMRGGGGGFSAPAARSGGGFSAPSIRSGGGFSAPSARSGGNFSAPSVRSGGGLSAPSVRSGGNFSAPAARSNAPAISSGGISGAARHNPSLGTNGASNVANRNFAGNSGSAIKNNPTIARHSGVAGANLGSANFVHKNFGNATAAGLGNNGNRHNGLAGNVANTSLGTSGFVNKNFQHVGGAKGNTLVNGSLNNSLKNLGGNTTLRNLNGNPLGATKANFTSANFSYRNNINNNFNNFNNLNQANFHHHGGNYWGNNSHFFGSHSPFGAYCYNRPRYGYGGYGYGGYGLGLGYYGGYGGYGYYPYRYGYGYGYGFPILRLLGLGWGCGLGGLGYGGYGGYGYGGYSGYGYSSVYDSSSYYATPIVAATDPTTAASVDPATVSDDSPADALDFAGQGETDFKAGKYKEAARAFRHALVDDPTNGAYVMLLGQALFASGQWDEAAGATQQATTMLPPDKWGTVIANYKELYTNIGDYTGQLRALEKARDEKPDDPGLRFLLGWHYGYLGYPKQAVRELNKTLELAPKDEVAKKVRDMMAEKLPKSDVPPPPPAAKPAPPDAEKGSET